MLGTVTVNTDSAIRLASGSLKDAPGASSSRE